MSRGAVHNALGRGELSAALSRAVGDSVGASGLERYGETLTPTLDLWMRPEWAYLRRELLGSFDVSQAAVVGEFSAIALVNPTGSGKLFTVESITAWCSVQALFTVAIALQGVITATLTNVTVPVSVDARWRDRITGADRTVGIVYGGSDPAGIGGQVERFTTPSGGSNYGRAINSVPLILPPGWGVALVCGTANAAISAGMRHRERAVFPGELE